MISGYFTDKDKHVIVDSVYRTSNALERMQGLLEKPLQTNEGLLITPCASVHTFFMRYNIDLVYLDRQFTIKKLVENLSPWKMSACPSASMTLELPANQITRLGLLTGRQLFWNTHD